MASGNSPTQAVADSATSQGDALLMPTQQVTTLTNLDGTPVVSEPLYGPGGPAPAGTEPGVADDMARHADASAATGPGIEGEEVVWEGHYSLRNFAGRFVLRVLLSIGWVVMAAETWANGHENWAIATTILGVLLLVYWAALVARIGQAHYSHFYRLTNRRLFVSTGLMRRRRDQMELLRVKDVFTRQTLAERWLSVGSVVVVSTEKELPIFYLSGVDDPKGVMDLVWHQARSERDHRSTNVHPV